MSFNNKCVLAMRNQIGEKSTQSSLGSWMQMNLRLLNQQQRIILSNCVLNNNRQCLADSISYIDEVYSWTTYTDLDLERVILPFAKFFYIDLFEQTRFSAELYKCLLDSNGIGRQWRFV